MTMPAEPGTGTTGAPGTGDPSNEPNEPTGQQPATGEGGTGNEPGTDWASTFEGMTPEEVKTALDHARTWEKRAKTNKAKLDQLTAQQQPGGKQTEGEPSLDQVRQELETERRARQESDERAVRLAWTSTVRDVAPKVGGDAEALLDSDRFRAAVDDELGEDGFDDDDLAAAVEKVAKRFVREPRFAGTRPTPPRGSGEFAGSPGAGSPITEEQLAQMTPEQITQALNEGKLKHLL